MLLKRYLIVLLVILAACMAAPPPQDGVTPETALLNYIHNGDQTFEWEVLNSHKGDGLTTYQVLFTSQNWRDIRWRHELFIMVPEELNHHDALLFVTGGSVREGEPRLHKMDDQMVVAMGQIALKNQAITSVLWQVPNQPLYGEKTEDELISHTFHNFLNDGDYTWPLLFPMTKSAIRAMDVIQEFTAREKSRKTEAFVVSGASKRGWTTWLTGASDPRVKAIAPMVIDVLNMPVNVDYHKVTWGDYSIQIKDYVDLGIAQQMSTEGGSRLVRMVDPYSYRSQLTMPKMIFMGTNDEYWPVDAIKNYIDSIPGKNHICYIANAGHGLGDKIQALNTLSAFFARTITGVPLPLAEYDISAGEGKIDITVKTSAEMLLGARLFSATSTDREFRDKKWEFTCLDASGVPEVNISVDYPETGFKAFYVELLYKGPHNHEYTESTRMFLAGENRLFTGINE